MPILTLTEPALNRLRKLISAQHPQPEGVLVSVTSKGCSGLRYDVRFLDRLVDQPPHADRITQDGITVVIDPRAALYLTGSTMDYRETLERSGFDFTNPNETGRCGCGESFTVERQSS